MNAHTPAWDKFLKSNFFSDPFNAWHDGEDVHVLKALNDEERAKAEAIFIKGLPDPRLIVGLEELRSQKALPHLHRLLKHADVEVSKNAAHAIFVISGSEEGLEPAMQTLIKTLLNHRLFWSTRMQAAIGLGMFRNQAASDALVKGLDDTDKLVRHHVAESLCKLYGLRVDVSLIYHGNPDAIAALKALVAAGAIKTSS